jgi:hypothetical protein
MGGYGAYGNRLWGWEVNATGTGSRPMVCFGIRDVESTTRVLTCMKKP